MNKFIEVTSYNTKKKLLVNLGLVEYIFTDDGIVNLRYQTRTIAVSESYDQIRLLSLD